MKTLKKSEKEIMFDKDFITKYFQHIMLNPKSLLSKIYGGHPELQNWVDSNVRGLPSFFCVRFDFLHSSTLKGRKARETLELEKS